MFPLKRPLSLSTSSFTDIKKPKVRLPPKVSVQDAIVKKEVAEPVVVVNDFVAQAITLSPLTPIGPDFCEDLDRESSFGDIEDWIRRPKSKPLLIVGPTGSGKTTAIEHFFIKHLKQFPDTYDETGTTREEKIDDCCDFLRPHGLLKTRHACIFDNIESYDLVIRDVLRKAMANFNKHRPFIMTSEDIFAEPAKSFAKMCTVVRLNCPSSIFITKVLKHKFALNNNLIQDIINTSIGNLACALNCASILKESQSSKNMFQDRPMDVPKATRCALIGENVPLLGGSSDTSFIGQMLQINTPQVPQSIGTLAKKLEDYSYIDIIDSVDLDHKLSTDQLWLLIQSTYVQGPKLSRTARFNLEWPRSCAQSKTPWTFGGYFYD